MREFKNPKAKMLFEKAEELERIAKEMLAEGIDENNGPCEYLREAAGLRVLADDIEDGLDNGIEIEDDGEER